MIGKSKVCLFAVLVLSFVGLVFIGSGSVNAAPPAGTISYWRLDETVTFDPNDAATYADSAGSNDGASTGAAPTQSPVPAAGRVKTGQTFGNNRGIDVPADASFDFAATDSFSIEFWVRGPAAPPPGTQIFVGREDGGSSLEMWVAIRPTGVAAFRLIANNGDGGTIEGATVLDNTKFYHVVAVRDANTGENLLYVDGLLETSAAVAYDPATAFSSPVAALNLGYLGGSHFVGTLDEIALYNKALSAAEVDEHYQTGLAGDGIDTLGPADDDDGKGGGGGGGGGGCFIATIAGW